MEYNGLTTPLVVIDPAAGKLKPSVSAAYGPYASIEEAYNTLTAEFGAEGIPVGLTVGIGTGDLITEYWFNGGTTKNHLLEKGGGTGTETEEIFTTVSAVENVFTIYVDRTPYAIISLAEIVGNSGTLQIIGANAKSGKIIVNQSGGKLLQLGANIVGNIKLPLSPNTASMLNYNIVGDQIYLYDSTIVYDTVYPLPQTIEDFVMQYFDSTTVSFQWGAPYANTTNDSVTYYDMRYSNSPIDPDNLTEWNSITKVEGLPIPLTPGTVQTFTLLNLRSNTYYYFYLKSVRVNEGTAYISKSTPAIQVKTLGSTDMSKAYRIPITKAQLFPNNTKVNTIDGDNGMPIEFYNIDRLIDEQANNIYLEDGYPDTTNKNYGSFWFPYKYSRNISPYYLDINLYNQYTLNRVYLYTRAKILPGVSIYYLEDLGTKWKKAGNIKVDFNAWGYIEFPQDTKVRWIRIAWDQMDFGSTSSDPKMPTVGMERFPDPESNSTLEAMYNMIIYGRAVTTTPDGIDLPKRRATPRRSVDQWFCANGWFYMQGKILSLISGAYARLFGALGQFMPTSKEIIKDWPDIKFIISKNSWTIGNSGMKWNLEELLEKSYKPYGLKPFIVASSVMDICNYSPVEGEDAKWMFKEKTLPDGLYWKAEKNGRPLDNYWLTADTYQPRPARGVGGLDTFFGYTKNPDNYKTYAYVAYNIAAKYGANALIDESTVTFAENENLIFGRDLLSGLEWGNESDQDWSGWFGYMQPEEHAAVSTAVMDANSETLSIPLEGKPIGIKAADPNFLSIGSSCASVNAGYFEQACLANMANRADRKIGYDVWGVHRYFSNIGPFQGSTDKIVDQHAVPVYDSIMGTEQGQDLLKLIDFRDRYSPSTEIWVTEWGFGESGGRGRQCKYQCFSQPGRKIGNWIIPDRHRSEVKGAWIVRGAMWLMEWGVEMAHYYLSVQNETNWDNYFDARPDGTGAGFEMWDWYKLTDETPGAKYEAIKPYEADGWRSGFNTTGLFANNFYNGGYPITNGTWWVMTFRNRLKDYIYTGMKKLPGIDEKVTIACFKHKDLDKGAYMIWYEDSQNTGAPNVSIPIPEGITNVTNVSVYIPKITDPRTVPANVGNDQNRTGMATARHETYTNGSWVLSNQPLYTPASGPVYGSLAQGAATYPENPQEGDEVVVLPTAEENPYYPIVGTIGARETARGNNPQAQQYEQEWPVGSGTYVVSGNNMLAYRQLDAIYDYVKYTEEGQKGAYGIEKNISVMGGAIVVNVSEYPEYYFFDAVPESTYTSKIENLTAVPINTETIHLYWNNTNAYDTHYRILISSLPETGYTLKETVSAGTENKYVVTGLKENTAYYFKVIPMLGDKSGELSDYTSATTFSFIEAPTNLAVSHRTSSSITLQWDYPEEQSSEFVYYGIYRGLTDGSFTLAGTVDNINIHTFKDTDLTAGTPYFYRIRIVGLSGSSDYTPTLETRTLTIEEASPVVTGIKTNKEGSKVNITFDLPLSTISLPALSSFTLTEDGVDRAIIGVSVDSGNPAILSLAIPAGALADYDKLTNVRLSYREDANLQSIYGVVVESFTDIKVINNTNNYTNIENEIWINLTKEGEPSPEDTRWNTIFTNIVTDYVLENTNGTALTVTLSTLGTDKNYGWGYATGGICDIEGIEKAVYGAGWAPPFQSSISENKYGRLIFSGLNTTSKYTFVGFGGTVQENADRIAKLKATGDGDPIYSAEVNQKANLNQTMTVEDVKPNSKGIIYLDFIFCTEEDRNTNYPKLSFVKITEYGQNDDPENRDVSIRGVTTSADENGTTVPEITVSLNLLGIGTHYRIGQTSDLSALPWIELPSKLSFEYTLDVSGGYGTKTIYVQVKNNYTSSAVVSKDVIYKDNRTPLKLKSIVLNNGAAETTTQQVSIAMAYEGTTPPTHMAIKESADIVDADYIAFANPTTFNLSGAVGQKTVYVRVKNDTEVSDIVSSKITLISGDIDITSINLTLPTTVNKGEVIKGSAVCLPANNSKMSEVEISLSGSSILGVSNKVITGNTITFDLTGGTVIGDTSVFAAWRSGGVEKIRSNTVTVSTKDPGAVLGYFDSFPAVSGDVLDPSGLVELTENPTTFSVTNNATTLNSGTALINGAPVYPTTATAHKLTWSIDKSAPRSVRYMNESIVNFQLSIPIVYTGGSEVSVTASIPPVKYNKKLTFILSQDDGKCSTFSQIWSRWNGRWTSDSLYYHKGLEQNRWKGSLPDHTMASTDGCGNEVRWRFNSCVYMSALSNTPSWTEPSILWNDVKETLTLPDSIGWCYHNVNESVYDKNNMMSIIEGLGTEMKNFYAETNYMMDAMLVPDGNINYTDAAKIDNSCKFIRITTGNGDGLLNLYSIDKPIYKYSSNLSIGFKDTNYNEVLPQLATMNTQTTPDVCSIGTHELNWEWLNVFETMYSLYGKPGLDNIWVTSYKEMAEYTAIRQNAGTPSVVKGINNAEIDVNIKELPYSTFHEITILVNIQGLAADTEAPYIDEEGMGILGLYGLTYKWDSTTNNLLINASWSRALKDTAEAMVAKYETNKDWQSRLDAVYYTNRLKSSLRASLLNRIATVDNSRSSIFIKKVELEGDDELGIGTTDFKVNVWYNTTDGLPRTLTKANLTFAYNTEYYLDIQTVENFTTEKKVTFTFSKVDLDHQLTLESRGETCWTVPLEVTIIDPNNAKQEAYTIPYRYKAWKRYSSGSVLLCPGQNWQTSNTLGSVYKDGATMAAFILGNKKTDTVDLFDISTGDKIGTAVASTYIDTVSAYNAQTATGDNSDIVPDWCFKPVRPGINRSKDDLIDHTLTITLPAGTYRVYSFFTGNSGEEKILRNVTRTIDCGSNSTTLTYVDGAYVSNKTKWTTSHVDVTLTGSTPSFDYIAQYNPNETVEYWPVLFIQKL